MSDTRQRDQLLRRIIAVLIVLRAATNFGKPFSPGSAFVVFGTMMRGLASSVVAPLFGIAMLVYAWGLWQNRPWAHPLAVLYAIWATANVVLFPIREGVPSRWAPWMSSIFAIPGIAIPWLAAWLTRRA
jgi:hypothetical protein